MELSVRLQMIFDLFPETEQGADIGCDHAYLPIALVKRGKCRKMIASDVAEGPLAIASGNIGLYQLENQIQTRLSDGLQSLDPGELQCFSMAGMGGLLMCRILQEAYQQGKLARTRCMILQPQSDSAAVRKAVHDVGFVIREERMVQDRGKFYIAMKAVPEEKHSAMATDVFANSGVKEPRIPNAFGNELLFEQRNPVFYEYLQHEIRLKKQACQQIRLAGNEPDTPLTSSSLERLQMLEKEIAEAEGMIRQWNIR